jgi:hypothetical protein
MDMSAMIVSVDDQPTVWRGTETYESHADACPPMETRLSDVLEREQRAQRARGRQRALSTPTIATRCYIAP